jgi:tetratricopeptide (TPR) repeat protein
MSNEGSLLSMSASDMRKEIECDQCEKSNPSKRCSRCHLTYYCSVECQRLHWSTHKVDCVPVEEMKNKLVGVTNISSSTSTDEETKQPSTEICSICLSETVEYPIVLPECGHTFCFACLVEWQNYTKNSLAARNERSSSQQGRCPNCRETIQVSIVDAAIEKAQLYAAAGRLTDKVYDHRLKTEQDTVDEVEEGPGVILMDERQEKFCKLAQEQVNQVLSSDPTDVIALCTKGQILRHVKPHDAIDALQEVLRLDEEGVKMKEKLDQVVKELDEFRALMDRTLTIAEIEDDNHPMVDEWGRRVEAAEKLVKESKRGVQINEGPHRLYRIKIWLAEAYESAHEYKKAEAIYKEMIQEVFKLDYEDYIKMDPPTNRMMISGASRCLFYVKDFDRSKKMAQMALDMNRHFPGIHILLAQAQWALNEKKDAIRTMCRGVLYETPWDETNQKRNRVYLQEFVDAMSGTNRTDGNLESAE